MFTNSFQELVQDFTPISIKEAEYLLAQRERTILFLGRASCPYCQRFIPKLHSVAQANGLTVYFIDSTNPDPQLQALRQRYQAATVPALLFASSNGVHVRCDSSMTEDEIRQFLTV
ncbi:MULTISPECIES: conjugal transfer protein TraF [unclassified Streptococcus]|uniref:conjugal transfer protein TraF n=1 Tax=unclassified Streptococcus TaxID=2608887 RepID=UPI0010727D57|nr:MULTISPECIES: conjugal transfer protein TraF [unclassified Streptococcus]MBF0788037.1 conjugal transfer protein TraF [Streptococcus sp. 19428wC2_LYSM12]MCQ9211801.1 conjugal transfer protein TraF [Streptococcus sp. B01]MCQ9212921.1 conjugal transfer protein TraF [Streptococcus sp. O1]TFV04909.1 thiol reductase thioredoxin [Streptococcus sp. LYSM12]